MTQMSASEVELFVVWKLGAAVSEEMLIQSPVGAVVVDPLEEHLITNHVKGIVIENVWFDV